MATGKRCSRGMADPHGGIDTSAGWRIASSSSPCARGGRGRVTLPRGPLSFKLLLRYFLCTSSVFLRYFLGASSAFLLSGKNPLSIFMLIKMKPQMEIPSVVRERGSADEGGRPTTEAVASRPTLKLNLEFLFVFCMHRVSPRSGVTELRRVDGRGVAEGGSEVDLPE